MTSQQSLSIFISNTSRNPSQIGVLSEKIGQIKWYIKFAGRELDTYKDMEAIRSPDFSIHSKNQIKWRLEFIPKEKGVETVSSFILRCISNDCMELTSYTISVLSKINMNEEVEILKNDIEIQGKQKRNFKYCTDDITKLVIKHGTPNTYEICISFEQKIDQSRSSSSRFCEQSLEKSRQALTRSWNEIFQNAEFSDIVLRVEGKEIRAHKAVLSGRSSVFNRMFKNNMKENLVNCVDIVDMTYDSLQLFLSYLYSGQLDIDTLSVESALELLTSSDKYNVEDLRGICTQFVESKLTTANCIEVLLHSDTLSMQNLKVAVMNFIAVNSAGLNVKPDWDEQLRANPNLCYEYELMKMMLKIK